MNKAYTRIDWENYPSVNTPINETNLNKMDFAVDELDNRIISQDTTKVNKTELNSLISDWSMDETTGIITITKVSGEQIIFDLNIEKIPVSFSLSDDGILTMITDDGTKFTANIGAMIPILTFNDSDEIAVSVSGTGVNKTYSFSIKANSITEDKLQPNFLADIKVQSASASSSASNAETSAKQAQSYAVGGTGTRDNENTDNAKYYKEQAQAVENAVPTYLSQIEAAGESQLNKIQDALSGAEVNFQVDLATGHLNYSGCDSFVFDVNKTNGHLEWRLA